MASSERAHLHAVLTANQYPSVVWTELGRVMSYTDTPAKRNAILRAAAGLNFTNRHAYGRLGAPHLAAVAAAALAGVPLRRAAHETVAGHPGWVLVVVDDVGGIRHYLLDLGYEAIYLLRQTSDRA